MTELWYLHKHTCKYLIEDSVYQQYNVTLHYIQKFCCRKRTKCIPRGGKIQNISAGEYPQTPLKRFVIHTVCHLSTLSVVCSLSVDAPPPPPPPSITFVNAGKSDIWSNKVFKTFGHKKVKNQSYQSAPSFFPRVRVSTYRTIKGCKTRTLATVLDNKGMKGIIYIYINQSDIVCVKNILFQYKIYKKV